jgi:hypothetical protein
MFKRLVVFIKDSAKEDILGACHFQQGQYQSRCFRGLSCSSRTVPKKTFATHTTFCSTACWFQEIGRLQIRNIIKDVLLTLCSLDSWSVYRVGLSYWHASLAMEMNVVWCGKLSWMLFLVSTVSLSAVSSCYTVSEMHVSQFHLTETVHKSKCTAMTWTHTTLTVQKCVLCALWLGVKRKAIPVQTYYRPIGFQVVEALWFWDGQHMKVVRLSALHTGCLYPPGNIPGTHFC